MFAYHAAPTTERPMQRAMPADAHPYGDIDSRKSPILNASPLPVKSISSVKRYQSMPAKSLSESPTESNHRQNKQPDPPAQVFH